MKRFLICLLALIMLLQITACAAQAAPAFADVSADAPYAMAVAWCAEKGLMNGVEDGTNFDPNGSMTRSMLATILYRQAGEPEVNGTPDFTDAKSGLWYSNAVTWAAEKELLRGYGNGLFGVDDPVSREMLQVVIARQNGEDPAWTGSEELSVDATRAEAAVALYETFRELEPTPTRRPSGGGSSRPSGGGSSRPVPTPTPTPTPTPEPIPTPETGKVLVAYFSATGNTRPVAEKVAELTGGDLFEIVPAQPYTSADLNYNTDCRANAEQNDPDARPAIQNAVEDMGQYDAVLIGYPIWWGKAPKIIHTFLESYDLSGKTVAAFCTSGGSGHEDATIRGYEPDATWLEGRRFSGTSQVESWVNGLDLPKATDEGANKMYLQIGGTVWTATLEDNPSVAAWKELLKKGPLSVDMSDYGGFEKVGDIGTTLTQSNRQITTKPGDIILYQGNSVTIYYDENSWNFTLLGHIDGVGEKELREVLKAGGDDISVIFSLEEPSRDNGVRAFDLVNKTVELNSGYTMPINGLGTYSLTGDECVASVKTALESGVRLIDTAYMYHNEAEVGRAIRESGVPREDIFVITKLYPGSQYDEPEQAIQDALDKLDIGYVDMMLLHHPGANDVKAYKAMEQAVTDGKIRSIGLSNWYVEELTDFLPQVDTVPALVQNEIHPYYQENDVIPFIQDRGIVVQGWYPLGGRGHTAKLLGDETISAIARTHGVSSAQVILRWNLQKGVVVIPGSSNPDHIKENTELYHFELTEDEMAQINALDRGEKHDWY